MQTYDHGLVGAVMVCKGEQETERPAIYLSVFPASAVPLRTDAQPGETVKTAI